MELRGERRAGEGQGEPLHAPLREEHATQPHTEKQQDEAQSAEADLVDDHRPEITAGFGVGLLWADTHHRRIDHGVLDAVHKQHGHPDQGIAPELRETQVPRQENAGQEIHGTHHRLVAKRPVDVAVAGQEPGGQLDQGV